MCVQNLPKQLGVSLLIALLSTTSAYAMPKEDYEFAGLKPVADEELGAMRGGFRFSNGVTLDFALQIRSMVDGAVVHEKNLMGDSFKHSNPEDFRTVLQVGNNNHADIPEATKVNVTANGDVTTTTTPSTPTLTVGNSQDKQGGSAPQSLPQNNPVIASSGSNGGAGLPPVTMPPVNIPSLESVLKGVNANNFPGMLTVIQNTLDNKTIQQFNILDVSVSNLAQYRLQALTAQINNTALGGH